MGMEDYGRTLSHSVLTGVVREFEPNKDVLGAKIFTTGPREKIFGSSVGIDIEKFPRTMPKYRHPAAESGKQQLMVVKHIDVTLPCIKESRYIDADTLNALRQPGTDAQAWGKAKIAAEAQALDIQINNRLEKSRWDVLTTGIVTQALALAGDIAFSIDFGIPTTPTTHVPALLTTARWIQAPTTAVPVTDIMGWKKTYAEDSGKVARYGICNSTVMSGLMNTTTVKALMGEQYKSDALRLGAIQTLCGLDLIVYDGGYVSGSTFYPFIGNDKFVLWSGDPFPEYVGIAPDVKATTPGKFSKAFESDDPSGVTLLETVRAIPSGERVQELFCATVD
jgi:hypothetical protein